MVASVAERPDVKPKTPFPSGSTDISGLEQIFFSAFIMAAQNPGWLAGAPTHLVRGPNVPAIFFSRFHAEHSQAQMKLWRDYKDAGYDGILLVGGFTPAAISDFDSSFAHDDSHHAEKKKRHRLFMMWLMAMLYQLMEWQNAMFLAQTRLELAVLHTALHDMLEDPRLSGQHRYLRGVLDEVHEHQDAINGSSSPSMSRIQSAYNAAVTLTQNVTSRVGQAAVISVNAARRQVMAGGAATMRVISGAANNVGSALGSAGRTVLNTLGL